MAEYDLVCDSCGESCDPMEAIVSWNADGASEGGFALTHPAHVPSGASQRAEVRRLAWPNEYLAFVNARFGKRIAEPEPLRAIVAALAPFVMRHDNPAEMDGMRAASFGAIPGVKPGTEAAPRKPAPAKEEVEAGK
ncbi:MAG TPA: hypothetical protein VGR87_15315 [Candidatus Limnocylindria bacterium]|nr:hypothetical protein [Candidatus Limnocylindria bacterium]